MKDLLLNHTLNDTCEIANLKEKFNAHVNAEETNEATTDDGLPDIDSILDDISAD